MGKLSCILILILITSKPLFSQSEFWNLFDTSNSGLPSNNLTALGVDSSNNIWIGTEAHGVTKYDGINWFTLNTSNSGLPSNNINSVLADQLGNLWIGTNDGLAKLNGSIWEVYNSQNSGLPGDLALNLALDSSGKIWGLSQIVEDSSETVWGLTQSFDTLYLYNFDGVNWQSFNCPENIDLSDPPEIKVDLNDDIWMCAGTSGLTHFDGVNWTNYNTTNSSIPSDYIWDIDIDLLGSKWLCTDMNGITEFNDTSWIVYCNSCPYPNSNPFPYNSVSNIFVDKRDVIWTSAPAGVIQFFNPDWISWDYNNSPFPGPPSPGPDIKDMKEDNNGHKWFCTLNYGLFEFFDPQTIEIVIETESVWIDADYDGIESGIVDASNTTISYGTINYYVWTIDGDTVALGPIINIDLTSGSKYLTLEVISNLGQSARDSILISVYASSVNTAGAIYSSVSQLSENVLFISSTDDKIYRFDTLGNVSWTIYTGGDIQSTTAIDDENNIYVGSDDTRLYSFNSDGIPNWDKALGGIIKSSPSIGPDSNIYVGINTGRFLSVSQDGTQILWFLQTGGAITSSAAIDEDGNIYFGSDDGKLYSINSDGQLNWDFQTGGSITASPAIGLDSSIVIGSSDGKLYKISKSGVELWNYNTGDVVSSSPIIGSNGKIYFGSSNGKFYLLTKDGDLVWDYNLGVEVNSTPTISNQGLIYFGVNDGRFICLDTNGVYKWSLITNDPIVAAPLISNENIIYIGGTDGNVYIIKEYYLQNEKIPISESIFEWPTFKGNNRRTGYSGDVVTHIQETENLTPTEYQLSQNYPNPFNNQTVIKYSIPKEGIVLIHIYNIIGEKVTTLVNEMKPTGYYTTPFDAAGLSSGIYFYRLQAGSFIDTKKMILIK